MTDDSQLLRYGYIALAAVSGAFTALGFLKWREMTRGEVLMTFGTGFGFAIFVTPWIAHGWLGIADTNVRAVAALTYVFGSGSNILLPFIIREVKARVAGGDAA